MASATEVSPMVDPLIGAPVGAFIIDRFIAQGGMGRVYTARHHIVDTHRAAVKVLVDTANVADRAAFEKEARAAAGVKSINIVTLLDFGLLGDRSPYLVFELLAGETLEAQLRRRRTIPFTEALGLTQQVLSALSVIHNAGLVHRDIKPANLFLVNDPSNDVVVKVMDLGLAAARPQKYHETGVGTEKELNRAGTPVYASPEQFGELTVGPASDIYSLGVVLYEMVTGEVPFAERPGESESALPRRHTKEKPKQPSGLITGLPLGVERLMLSMLEKDPRQRPTVIAARNEIIRLREQNRDQVREGPTQIRANPLAPPTRNTDQLPRLPTEEPMAEVTGLRRDNRAWLVGAAVVVALLLGLGIVLLGQQDKQVKVEGEVAVTHAPSVPEPAAPVDVADLHATDLRPEQEAAAAAADPEIAKGMTPLSARTADELTPLSAKTADELAPLPTKPADRRRPVALVPRAALSSVSRRIGQRPKAAVVDRPDCVFTANFRNNARQEGATLHDMLVDSRPDVERADADLQRGLAAEDCVLVNAALDALRGAAGIHAR